MRRVSKWLGLLLGLGLCAYFLARMDWSAFFSQVRAIQALPAAGMLAAITLSTVGRAVRWRMLTMGGDRARGGQAGRTRLHQFWRAVAIGYLGNYVYPARAGEVLRIMYLHRISTLPSARVLTSSMLDRGLDVVLLAGCAFVLAWMGLFTSEALRVLPFLAGGMGIALVGMILLLRFDAWFRSMANRLLTSLRPPGQARFAAWLEQGLDALDPLRSPRVLVLAAGCSAAVVFLDVLAVWMLLLAFDWGLSFSVGLTLYVFLGLGAALPTAPGYLGIYQAVSVLILGMYGISETGALAFAFTLQGLSLCLFLVLGGVAVVGGRCWD
jgi:glycosyltransferase 2 family protein